MLPTSSDKVSPRALAISRKLSPERIFNAHARPMTSNLNRTLDDERFHGTLRVSTKNMNRLPDSIMNIHRCFRLGCGNGNDKNQQKPRGEKARTESCRK